MAIMVLATCCCYPMHSLTAHMHTTTCTFAPHQYSESRQEVSCALGAVQALCTAVNLPQVTLINLRSARAYTNLPMQLLQLQLS
jgi:hypothetical protein